MTGHSQSSIPKGIDGYPLITTHQRYTLYIQTPTDRAESYSKGINALLKISRSVLEKLRDKHQVEKREILEAFANRDGAFLEDQREQHKSDPSTQWFIAETDYGRKLKVAFIAKDGDIIIRTAYAPNATEMAIYQKYAY